ncbi:hypothetical protein [Aeromonas veronii]|uniref:hypothetical protein n=1 Tax=Aeromonas veronii TaxID=654 RepID=UPI002444CD0B|nr:hypothetical protein [Aeromonas veronii]
MMRITTLAAIIGMTMSSSMALANNNEGDYFATIYQEHQSKMAERLQALRAQAANGESLVIKDGKRHIEINGTLYRLNNENYIIFDMPKPVFLDETGVVSQISQKVMTFPAQGERYTRGFLTGRPRVFSLFIAHT